MARWTKLMEPVKGAKVVVYHPTFIYFVTRFGLVQVGTIEDRPGIPPSPQHLVTLIRQMKEERVKVVLVEPWSDQKLAARVAEEAGARAVWRAALERAPAYRRTISARARPPRSGRPSPQFREIH